MLIYIQTRDRVILRANLHMAHTLINRLYEKNDLCALIPSPYIFYEGLHSIVNLFKVALLCNQLLLTPTYVKRCLCYVRLVIGLDIDFYVV